MASTPTGMLRRRASRLGVLRRTRRRVRGVKIGWPGAHANNPSQGAGRDLRLHDRPGRHKRRERVQVHHQRQAGKSHQESGHGERRLIGKRNRERKHHKKVARGQHQPSCRRGSSQDAALHRVVDQRHRPDYQTH